MGISFSILLGLSAAQITQGMQGEVRIFTRHPQSSDMICVDASGDCTIEGLQALIQEQVPSLRVYDITIGGEVKPPNTLLADAGVTSESAVDVVCTPPFVRRLQNEQMIPGVHQRTLMSSHDGNVEVTKINLQQHSAAWARVVKTIPATEQEFVDAKEYLEGDSAYEISIHPSIGVQGGMYQIEIPQED